jgi:S-adenosylmethionine:tRNA ribosyltransferase-isomerase
MSFPSDPTADPTGPTADPLPYVSPRPPSGLDMADFDYDLPEAAIAQHPIEPRDSARLLDATTDTVSHRVVRDLPTILRPGDLLVCNETRVIPARIRLRKVTGGAAEVLLLDQHKRGDASTYWSALVRPSKTIAPGTVLSPGAGLHVRVDEVLDGGQRAVSLLGDDGDPLNPEQTERALAQYGEAPLPPYITAPLANAERYQTTYARLPGSAAAPTAGLHFTPELLAELRALGIRMVTVDLTVGLDTFRPVSVDRPEDHDIHSERYSVPSDTSEAIAATKAAGGRIVAVGTTSVRALESAAASGTPTGRTALFIYGDYPFQIVDVLLTNFHMPRTSLLLLIDAFAGPKWRDLYREALTEGYRFLSFGDAMLLARRDS